ncbi:MAG: 16S rRNA (uracil(1498)-N(3))-methyltransferase [Candidatus Omnitrophica bacterium]|nr:16S rRNA (uracil(1498)-N(3))-methyltransferase [Candidatus Omnitrophota bacterium]
MRRIYLDPADCEKNHTEISIKDSSFHYLSNVLRMKKGDTFLGFDGSGIEYTVLIVKMERKTIKGEILKTKKITEIELPFNINLFQSLPKGSKMDKIIDEVAQLGIKKIYPVISCRTIPQITEENIIYKKSRWKRIAVEASKIAGRDFVMEVENPINFKEAVRIPADVKFIFWEKATLQLKERIRDIPKLKKGASVNVFIGPEGGYTDEEISLAKEYGALSVSMGKRILRVETASVVAVALTIYELENL